MLSRERRVVGIRGGITVRVRDPVAETRGVAGSNPLQAHSDDELAALISDRIGRWAVEFQGEADGLTMSKAAPKIVLDWADFYGDDQPPVGVSFKDGLNVLFGASNTGKTFTVKSLDFMLGGNGPLPDISERYRI